MARVTEELVREALSGVIEPRSGRPIGDLGMISNLVVTAGNVGFVMEVPPDRGPELEGLRKAAGGHHTRPSRRALVDRGHDRAPRTTPHPAPTGRGNRRQSAPSSPWRAARAASASRPRQPIWHSPFRHSAGKSCSSMPTSYGPSAPRLFGLKGKPGDRRHQPLPQGGPRHRHPCRWGC